MQVENGVIFQAREPLAELLKERLPIKTAYWLTRLAKQVNEHYATIEDLRVRLITEYGTANGNKQVSVTPDNPKWPEFVAAFNELMAEQTEITVPKVKLPPDGLQVTPATLMALEEFIEVEVAE